MNAKESTRTFLQGLWPEEPLPGSLVVWTRSKRGENTSSWCGTPAEAVEVAARSRHDRDVYFGLALQDRDTALATARREKPSVHLGHVRGFSSSATAIPGLWMDVDIKAPVHREQNLPPDLPAALSLLEVVPYEPTLIVDSGFGIHAYWLFRGSWVFESAEDRGEAHQLVSRLQGAVRSEAARRGWALDGTADLARVLRLPGTLNHKQAPSRKVAISRLTLDRRYDPSDFAAVLPEVPFGDVAAERPAAHDEGTPADLAAVVAGCVWLRHCHDNAATLAEPEWYAMLGIVGRCASPEADGRELAHQWSADYSGYTRTETDRKLDHALGAAGPRSCNHIGSELGGIATFCGACPHRGRIRSPIVLGRPRPAPPGPAPVNSPAVEVATSAEGVADAVRALCELGDDPEPEEVGRLLDSVARSLDGAEPLAVQATRESVLRALQGKVRAPASFVDAALFGTRRPNRPQAPNRDREDGTPYRATEHGLVWLKPTREGEAQIPLTNFTAQIVGEVARDNGGEVARCFEIEARHGGRDHRFEVSAAKFSTLSWAIERLGAQAVVGAGMGTRDHARAAIQHLSHRVQTRTVYTHLGWRQFEGQWGYLHAGGAIGAAGPISGVDTDPPSQLRLYQLPGPGVESDLRRCVQESLRILDLLPDEVTVPLYCGVWRSVLGACDFSEHLAGQTGEGKSELAALVQQHFGSELDARHLPGSWSSTSNALEALAFSAKDALLVVDDFAPAGTTYDVQRQNQDAARLFRAQGNRSGRNRLRPDGELRAVMAPRGLILSTGEDVPTAHSIRARLLVLEVPAGGMDWAALTDCQAAAREGRFARVLSAYLQWVAGRYEQLQDLRPVRTAALRALATTSGCGHRRTPSIVAELAHGLEVFLAFACEVEALSEAEAQDIWHRGWWALGQAGGAQAEHQTTVDPVRRFQELLASAMTSGRAHVVAADGTAPATPAAWGWRRTSVGTGAYQRDGWQPQGDQVGWLCEEELYLDPDAAFKAAQAMATGEGLTVTSRTLWKRLKERGLLASTDEPRRRNTVRVTLQGTRREVLHLDPEALLPEKPSLSSQPSQEPGGVRGSGPVLWDGLSLDKKKPSQKTVPRSPEGSGLEEPAGTIGTVGTVCSGLPGDPETAWRDV